MLHRTCIMLTPIEREEVMASNSQQNAQGGQDDTKRQEPQSDYQTGSGEASSAQDKDTSIPEQEARKSKKDSQQNAQGGQDDTERRRPQSDYQQG